MLRGFINALNATYLMHPVYAEHLAAIAFLVRKGQIDMSMLSDEIDSGPKPYIFNHQRGKLSVIHAEGPLFRDDQICGELGMISMSNQLKKYDQNKDIDAHLIKMHTPGGQVAGVEIFADTIANTEKPTIIFGEDVFSGGVYLAAGGSAIVLSGKNAMMGSIGVQSSYLSFKKKFESEGIDEITIKATTSPDKNNYNLEDPSDEDKLRYAKEILDPIHAHFIDHIKTHRPGVDESVLTGKEYYAEDAIRLGLADHIGTIESAIELAFDMAGKPQIKSTGSKTYMSMETNPTTQKPVQKPEAVAEVSSQPVVPADSPQENEELVALQHRNKVLEEMVAAKDRVITVHLQTIEAQATLLTQQKAEIARMAKLPAADPEAEVTAPEGDVTAQEPKGAPLPAEIQAALASGQKTRQRHIKKGIIKE